MKFILFIISVCWIVPKENNPSLEVKTKWVCEMVRIQNEIGGIKEMYITRVVVAKDSIQADSVFMSFIKSLPYYHRSTQDIYQINSLKSKTINP